MKPHRSEYWLIPPKENAEFVYRMEMILSLYEEPYDETRPVICFDESSKELRKHVRDPLPASPGAVARTDHHYERNGKRMLHLATEPLTGRCRLHVTERRRTCEWIDCMQAIADDYPDAVCIRVVLDNLSTHNPAAFYRFFPPEKAREYLDRFEFYYTPTHGSWLNMAELVWSTLQTQCLNRRISNAATLQSEVAAWEAERNKLDVTINWQFTNEDARTKLHRLYPTIEEAEN
ncbi:IS630 family transposase [Natrinema soli]|uniref:IS630 family transposase n=1 Tax=Natrinema soli TaxID=1930624 RepID=A0ABD5SF83_9EURY